MSDLSHSADRTRILDLQRDTDFTATLFESLVGYAVIAADFDGNILAYNEGARQIYGYGPDEVCGKRHIDSFFPPDFLEAGYFQQVIDVLLGTGRFSYEGEKIRKGGERFPAHILFTLTKDTTGKVVGFVEIVQDLTDRKRVEEELRNHRDQLAQANDELRQENAERRRAEAELHKAKEAADAANRAKSEFLANMSHEIRTPMNGIIGMTEVTLDTELTPEQRGYLEIVKASADALLTVINDILDFSKIEAGKFDLDAIDFRLSDRLSDTIKPLALRAHKKGLELACHIAADVPDDLVGDAGRLGQIVINLVGNAIKFTERGEVVVRVAQQERTEDRVVLHVTVRDTGIGIPLDKQHRIFEAFTQADNSTTRLYGGTGLGVTISRKLIEMMGGRLWLESVPGQGTTFHFTAALGVRQGPKPIPVEILPVRLQGLAVLIVDDNATNRLILQEVLSKWSMKPTAVDSARAALAEMQRAAGAGDPFDLVLVDAQMPEMDGFELARQIRQHQELAGAVLLMLSSADQHRDIAHCREVGIERYLLKPIKQSELRLALIAALSASLRKEPAPVPVARAQPLPAPALPSPARPARILLAEDNHTNQVLALLLLERQGHTVVVAANGQEALAALEKQSFDLVLMDVQMPLMDGFEATRRLREREQETGQHLPVIAMTAHAMKGDRERCLAAGMDGYVAKPIHANDLYQAMRPFLPAPAVPVETEAIRAETTLLLERFGGNAERLQKIVGIFAEESAQLMAEMRAAIDMRDADRLRRAAHSLKGAVGIFGVDAATQAALELESMGSTADLTHAEETWTALAKLLERIAHVLPSRDHETARG